MDFDGIMAIVSTHNAEKVMTKVIKRRKISEIFDKMNEITKRKPTEKELDELAEVLNETEDNGENDLTYDKIAAAQLRKGNLDGNQSHRVQ